MRFGGDRFSFCFFCVSVLFLVFLFGVAVGKYRIFPYSVIALAERGYQGMRSKTKGKIIESARKGLDKKNAIFDEFKKYLPSQHASNFIDWIYKSVEKPYKDAILNTGQAYEGLNLVIHIARKRVLSAKIINLDGTILHQWKLNWFKIWPDSDHLSERWVPNLKPGTHIHGAVIMDNGDLVFNFEFLGLVRIDLRGKVVWRLPYQTHHSVHLHDDGHLWVSGQKEHREASARFPNRIPPFVEYTILEVSSDGQILQEWSIPDLLIKNGRAGLLYMGSLLNLSTKISGGDALHLNDVEPFPDNLKEGYFGKGDVMVSLRNINTVFVFNRASEKIKFFLTGMFVRQHDPDFLDGNRISIFDNNNIAMEEEGPQSRIVIVSAPDKKLNVYYEGRPGSPFFSDIMGKHQWLPNGNLLITESRQGRAFELNKDGEIVWEFINYVREGVVGILEEVQRLPSEFTSLYSAQE